ncbi:MAG: LemA family protein [Candidatus Nanopelagicales bacterium]|nr:LemA family protein [Candidatus Nanopelagicales bacterium]
MVWVIVLLAIVVLIVIVGVIIYNSLISVRNKVDESWAQISVQLKRRHDLIPTLVSTVKGYATHEKGTLEAVTEARNTAVQAAGSPAAAAGAENALSGALKNLFALSEGYPDLKASTNFSELQQQLVDTEDRIAFSRQYYNDVVRQWNTKIETVPFNIAASAMHESKREYFDILDVSGTRVIETMAAEETIKPPTVEF